MTDSFEFDVKAKVWTAATNTCGGNTYVQGQPVYTVELPHQCDEWTVTYTPDPARAVAEMERFIAEAQQALETLRQAIADAAG